jgi:hypothetical protein
MSVPDVIGGAQRSPEAGNALTAQASSGKRRFISTIPCWWYFLQTDTPKAAVSVADVAGANDKVVELNHKLAVASISASAARPHFVRVSRKQSPSQAITTARKWPYPVFGKGDGGLSFHSVQRPWKCAKIPRLGKRRFISPIRREDSRSISVVEEGRQDASDRSFRG